MVDVRAEGGGRQPVLRLTDAPRCKLTDAVGSILL